MAILIIEQNGRREAGSLCGRVLIGRWPDNSVFIDDRTVSRVHAWIGVQNGAYYVSDAGSRTGTIVNDILLRSRHVLSDGDEIRIGPALLTYRTCELPAHTRQIDLTPQSAAALSSTSGDFLECTCGAPLWLPHGYSGKPRCRYCGHSVKRLLKKQAAKGEPAVEEIVATEELPAIEEPAVEQPVAEQPAVEPHPIVEETPALRLDVERICGICHSPISAFDQVTPCGSCGLPFHSECWEENHGCSAYGCDQVGVLDRRNAG